MSNPIPSELALASIVNGQKMDATPVQSNYAAVEAAVNDLIVALSNGVAGQVLEAVDASNVQWGIPNGTVLVHGKQAANKSTGGGTFGLGVDLLSSTIPFTADGTSDYEVEVSAYYVTGDTNGVAVEYFVNLDGAQSVAFGVRDIPTANVRSPGKSSATLIAPAAGAHTVDVRLINGGGAGNVTVAGPITVKVTKLG